MLMADPQNSTQGWSDQLLKNPHAAADKRARVQRMFAGIAPTYDLNNRIHSLGQDQRWRSQAVRLAGLKTGDVVVDVACGTGDLSLKFADAHAAQVLGVDFTYNMLLPARAKSASPGRYSHVCWINGDALSLPLPDASADVVSIAFGIRNVVDPQAAIAEFVRILRPAGRVIILEFSLPSNPLLRTLYNFYFRKILPVTASLISGDRTGAYRYLPESVNTFIGRQEMLTMMQSAGLVDVQAFPMTFGVCICYRGHKRT